MRTHLHEIRTWLAVATGGLGVTMVAAVPFVVTALVS
jgi:hypothetical protein